MLGVPCKEAEGVESRAGTELGADTVEYRRTGFLESPLPTSCEHQSFGPQITATRGAEVGGAFESDRLQGVEALKSANSAGSPRGGRMQQLVRVDARGEDGNAWGAERTRTLQAMQAAVPGERGRRAWARLGIWLAAVFSLDRLSGPDQTR